MHIPYRGITPAMIDVTAGGAQMMIVSPLSALPLARAGKLRLLAVTTDKRASIAPNVPTMKEMGYPVVTGTGRGFAMPAGVPAAAVTAMEAVLKRVHEHPAWKDFARASGTACSNGNWGMFTSLPSRSYSQPW